MVLFNIYRPGLVFPIHAIVTSITIETITSVLFLGSKRPHCLFRYIVSIWLSCRKCVLVYILECTQPHHQYQSILSHLNSLCFYLPTYDVYLTLYSEETLQWRKYSYDVSLYGGNKHAIHTNEKCVHSKMIHLIMNIEWHHWIILNLSYVAWPFAKLHIII